LLLESKVKNHVSIDDNKSSGLRLYANQLDRIGASGSYINSREVTKRFRVDPGNYVIIPSTYDEDHDCEFMLRIFTEQVIEAK
jgi:calpain, invertebrate